MDNSPLSANQDEFHDSLLDELDDFPPDLLNLIQPNQNVHNHNQIHNQHLNQQHLPQQLPPPPPLHLQTPQATTRPIRSNQTIATTPLVSTNFSNQNTPIIPMGTFTNSSPITPIQPQFNALQFTSPPSFINSRRESYEQISPIGLGVTTIPEQNNDKIYYQKRNIQSETNLNDTTRVKIKKEDIGNFPDSPTTIDCTSPKSDLEDNEKDEKKKNNNNVTVEDILETDPFENIMKKEDSESQSPYRHSVKDENDPLNEFLDFDKNEEIASIFSETSKPQQSQTLTPKKKRNSVPKFQQQKTTNNNNKVLKKSSSFNGQSTFITNPKLQWTKNNHGQNSAKQRSLSSNYSLGDLNHNGQPIFTLSNHYSFVYENNENNLSNSNPNSSHEKQQQHQQNKKFYKESLKNLESGLIEFQLDLKKK
ncbi:unnamed protein product [Candida verbasci]|uniref:Uncharacterized protein n=1 Tax=Candida verbasci TaxID=1227364 RepID=A0A9W4TWL4_9ASCO|nr:unnamed protein product [Candida verbasci]